MENVVQVDRLKMDKLEHETFIETQLLLIILTAKEHNVTECNQRVDIYFDRIGRLIMKFLSQAFEENSLMVDRDGLTRIIIRM